MKNYVIYKCTECGTEFIIPIAYIDYNNNYITCPMHGKHTNIIVVGSYYKICECMEERAYKRNKHGAIEQIKNTKPQGYGLSIAILIQGGGKFL